MTNMSLLETDIFVAVQTCFFLQKGRVARNLQKSSFITGAKKYLFSNKILKANLSELILLHLWTLSQTKSLKTGLPEF